MNGLFINGKRVNNFVGFGMAGQPDKNGEYVNVMEPVWTVSYL